MQGFAPREIVVFQSLLEPARLVIEHPKAGATCVSIDAIDFPAQSYRRGDGNLTELAFEFHRGPPPGIRPFAAHEGGNLLANDLFPQFPDGRVARDAVLLELGKMLPDDGGEIGTGLLTIVILQNGVVERAEVGGVDGQRCFRFLPRFEAKDMFLEIIERTMEQIFQRRGADDEFFQHEPLSEKLQRFPARDHAVVDRQLTVVPPRPGARPTRRQQPGDPGQIRFDGCLAQGRQIEFARFERKRFRADRGKRNASRHFFQRLEGLYPGVLQQQIRWHARTRGAGFKARITQDQLVAGAGRGEREQQAFFVVAAAFERKIGADGRALVVEQQRVFTDQAGKTLLNQAEHDDP